MSVRTRRIISCLIVTAATVLALAYTIVAVEPDGTVRCKSGIEAFHMLPENSCEVLIIGSSHSWRSVDPISLYENTGIGAYNYSTENQRLNTMALFLFDALRTQSPKVILLEMFKVDALIVEKTLCHEVYFSRSISDFPYKRKYLSQVFGRHPLRYLDYLFPLSMYHSDWDEMSSSGPRSAYRPEQFVGTMGFCRTYYSYDEEPITIPDYKTFKQKTLRKGNIALLDEMVNACRERGIKLVFFTVPYEGEFNYSDVMREYAEENGQYYLDFFELADEIGLDAEHDFSDKSHMNNNGAEKVTRYLGRFLKENFTLEDMRLHPGNLWEGKVGNEVGIP